jgi:hypothetical protein
MDAFLAIVLGSIALALGAFIVLGILNTPGSGAEQVGWAPTETREERESVIEAEDLEQMLEATNVRRRARGEEELTVDGLLAEEEPGGL